MPGRHRGFTLVELMVTLAILAFLMMAATPMITSYATNSRVRAMTQSVYSGLLAARTEAVRRNLDAEFLLTSFDPIAANVKTATAGTAASNWMVRAQEATVDPANPPDPVFVTGKSVNEGGTGVVITLTGDGSPSPTSMKFNSLGANASGNAAQYDVRFPTAGDCEVAGVEGVRCLRVLVSRGGQVRICDPAVSDRADSRYCGA